MKHHSDTDHSYENLPENTGMDILSELEHQLEEATRQEKLHKVPPIYDVREEPSDDDTLLAIPGDSHREAIRSSEDSVRTKPQQYTAHPNSPAGNHSQHKPGMYREENDQLIRMLSINPAMLHEMPSEEILSIITKLRTLEKQTTWLHHAVDATSSNLRKVAHALETLHDIDSTQLHSQTSMIIHRLPHRYRHHLVDSLRSIVDDQFELSPRQRLSRSHKLLEHLKGALTHELTRTLQERIDILHRVANNSSGNHHN